MRPIAQDLRIAGIPEQKLSDAGAKLMITASPPATRGTRMAAEIAGLCFTCVGVALIAAGVIALVQSALGAFLPHDLRYLEMTPAKLCGLGGGRVAKFMFHDRVSFGGAIAAIGVLYLWLANEPLRRSETWAWWTFLISGAAGFGSFLAYLGYGYFDRWHAASTAALLPIYGLGLALTAPSPLEFGWCRKAVRNLRTNPSGWKVLLLALAMGLVVGGSTILVVGMTQVFVSQDLGYLKLGASDLGSVSSRLLPLIAHDRAAFGGAVATCGLIILCCALFGGASESLHRVISLAGTIGFMTAIVIHPLIGYNNAVHLAPALIGASVFTCATRLWSQEIARETTSNEKA